MYATTKSSNQPDARTLPCALRAPRQSTFPSQILDLTFLTLRFQPRPRHPRDPRSTSCMTHFRKNTSVYIKTHSLRAHVRLTQFSRASWHPWLHRPARPVNCRLFFCKSLQSFFSLLQVTAFTIFTPKKIASSILPSFFSLGVHSCEFAVSKTGHPASLSRMENPPICILQSPFCIHERPIVPRFFALYRETIFFHFQPSRP